MYYNDYKNSRRNKIMAYNQNVNNYIDQQLLFSNQGPATTGDIYAAISTILSGMNLPDTTDIANQVYCIIQPELAQCLNRADKSRINMEQHIEMLIKQHWSQVMQNEKLRKVKRSSIRRYTRNEAGFGLCMEAGKQDVKIGYIEIQKILDLRIGKDGIYHDYKYVVYLDSKKEYRNVMIPLEKLSSKNLISLFQGFEYVCNNSKIANEYLAWCINTYPNPNYCSVPEYPGFSIMTENEKEYAVFCCNDNNVDIEILEKCSDSFKSKIMPDGSLNVDEIKSYVKAYLNTTEKIVLFAYSICGLLSTVLHDISYPIKQILSIASPNDDFTRQAGYYLQTYNKNKSILSFDNNIRTIEKTFHNAKDETVVIKDCINVDNEKRRCYVMNELLVWDSDKQTKPHNTAVISAGAQYIIHNNQKICMTLSDDFYTCMTYEEEENMCRALSLMTRCIINVICKNYENFKQELKDNIDNAMETDKAQDLPFIHSMISYSVIISVIEMLGKYLNIPIQNMEISDYLLEMFRISTNVIGDNSDAIADEFIKKLNAKIRSDEISIIIHKKDMEFIQGDPQIIIKDNLILMEESTLNEVFLTDMSTTESVYHILESLNMTDLLHATKKLRCPCTVYYKGMSIIVSFIAVKLHVGP